MSHSLGEYQQHLSGHLFCCWRSFAAAPLDGGAENDLVTDTQAQSQTLTMRIVLGPHPGESVKQSGNLPFQIESF